MDTPTTADLHLTSALAVKLPPFWPQNAKVWFAQAEAQFALGRITASQTKFYHTTASLNETVAREVEDLLEPQGDHPYEHLKQKLMDRFVPTEEERFRTLTNTSPLGDRRPTQLLREMRHAAAGIVDVESPFFRQLFLHRLPPAVQLVLKAFRSATIDDLARAADNLVAVDSPVNAMTGANAAVDSSDAQQLRQDIADLRRQVRSLTMSPSRFRSAPASSPRTSPSRHPARRRSSPSPPTNVCYFHRKFGRRARRCRQPCSFSGN
uniref:Retrotransposon gag domain-containing protein n=1 Tax=Trichuris muris TaxID=70415 RepID=A0A5S6Q3D6_TRIMR